MGRIIVALGLAGIAAITALSYRLAGLRISSCGMFDNNCIVRAEATRDATLTAGLGVGLAFLLASLTIIAVIRARQGQGQSTSSRTANPARRPLLRS